MPTGNTTVGRRDLLKVSIATATTGVLASVLPGIRHAVADESERMKGAILIVLAGGMSSWDSLDYKQRAPSEMRGPFDGIGKQSGDAMYSELFPNLAQESDSYLLLRAMEAQDAGVHSSAYKRWVNASGRNLVTELSQRGDGIPYAHGVLPGVDPMFTPEREAFPVADSLFVEWDQDCKKCALKEESDLTGRLSKLLPLRKALDGFGTLDSKATRIFDERYEVARKYLVGALANVQEKPTVESRRLEKEFGDHPYGRMLQLAGYLSDVAEAGIVVVETGHWDHHWDIRRRMEPARELDQGLAALIRHYSNRCTIAMRGEFGRSPQPQVDTMRDNGRSHFPIHAGLLSGPGIKNGEYGITTNRFEVLDQRVTDQEFASVFLEAAGAAAPNSARSGLATMLNRRS